MDIDSVCALLRKGANQLALHTAAQKNHALECVAASILNNRLLKAVMLSRQLVNVFWVVQHRKILRTLRRVKLLFRVVT